MANKTTSISMDQSSKLFIKQVQGQMANALAIYCNSNDCSPTSDQMDAIEDAELTTRDVGVFFFNIGFVPSLNMTRIK